MSGRAARSSAWHTSCGQAAALLLAFAVPLGNQPSVIFLRSELSRSMKWDGLAASRPLVSEWGHHIYPCPLRSSCGEIVTSALCFGVRRVSAPVMSHLHRLFIDLPLGIISQCSLNVLPIRLRCLFAWKWLALRLTVFLLFSQLSWSQKKEMKQTTRHERFYSLSIGQVHHLFCSKLVLVRWR